MEDLKRKIREFAEERDWNQFHSPKNLAMALSVEVSELVEHFQWLTEDQSYIKDPDNVEKIKYEIGDILIYLTMLSDKLDIDPLAAAKSKMIANERKYPVDKAKGNAKKYSEFET